jgi:hypothetical protein
MAPVFETMRYRIYSRDELQRPQYFKPPLPQ